MRRLGFAARLAVTFGFTLLLVGVLAYAVATRVMRHQVTAQEASYQRAQAHELGAVARGKTWPQARAEITTLIEAAAKRPGTKTAVLISPQYAILDVRGNRLGAARDDDPHIVAALQRGAFYAGRVTDPHGDPDDFEFVSPVNLPSGRFALQSIYTHRFFDDELARLRNAMIAVGLFGLVGGLALFYLLGGRFLIRVHKRALARARLDGLTDLPNQPAFQEDLAHARAIAERHADPLAVAVFDVDDFKFLNDRYGHGYGDEMLRQVARTLCDGRDSDRGYRIGGDEFALLLPHTDLDGARLALRRLQARLGAAHIWTTVGIAARRPGEPGHTLVQEADAALLEGKRRGGRKVLAYEDVAESVAITTSSKVDALRRLLETGEIGVAFQPIWDLEREELIGVEALTRPPAEYGFEGPAELFDVAEQAGRVQELDRLCVTRILGHANGRLPPGAHLFVNLAPRTLDLYGLGDGWLLDAVQAADIEPTSVVIEVTERFGGRTSSIVKSLRQLRRCGLRLALDDVGTGNSGLEMMRRVEVDYVKLDRDIVTGAMTEIGARAVLVAITAFANETGSYVIAEGIEDEEVLDFVRGLEKREDVDRARIRGGQGYGLGRPSPSLPTSRRASVLLS